MKAQEQIQPGDIDANQRFWEAFGHLETEISAAWIVILCQEQGSWLPFTEEEIEALYNRHGYTGFRFNKLISEDQKYLQKDGATYSVTLEFIERCYRASPKEKYPVG